MPLADEVLTWLDQHKPLMASHPYASAYLVPQVQSSPDALKVEQTLLTMHLREQRTPEQFLSAIYVSKGWNEIEPSLLSYQAQMAKARSTGNTRAAGVLGQQWKAFTTKFGEANPIWYADYNNPTKSTSALTALAQLKDLNSKNMLGNSNVVPGIKDLLNSYESYHSQLLANTYANSGRVTPLYSQIKTQWVDYLNQLVLDRPELTNVATGVFKKVV